MDCNMRVSKFSRDQSAPNSCKNVDNFVLGNNQYVPKTLWSFISCFNDVPPRGTRKLVSFETNFTVTVCFVAEREVCSTVPSAWGPAGGPRGAYPVASGAIKMTTFGLNILSSSSTFPLEMVQVTSAPRDILVTVTFIRHPEAADCSNPDFTLSLASSTRRAAKSSRYSCILRKTGDNWGNFTGISTHNFPSRRSSRSREELVMARKVPRVCGPWTTERSTANE
mmetsp:Transcript_443/g.1722  ORF Transcript_443/g.1722 Transcript_443/m.1722 type:complete len:224 (-) Transcript_443:81-752(-)